MLAIAMYSEYDYDIDIKKVVTMLYLHELEEIYIGDLTPFQIAESEKQKTGHEAVLKVVDSLQVKDSITDLIKEFDERKTKEAKFAHLCDKLEADLQAKIYDEDGYVDLNNQDGNDTLLDPTVQKHIKSGKSFSEMWLLFNQEKYSYDKPFIDVSNYAINNRIKTFTD